VLAPAWVPVPPPAYGGIENVVVGLVQELARREHDVVLVAAPGSRVPGIETVSALDDLPEAFGHVDADLAHGLGGYDAFSAVDVVVDHTGLSGALLSAWSDVPTLHVCHNRIDGAVGASLRRIARRVRDLRLIAISHAQRRLEPALPFAGVCPNGVDVATLPFRERHDGYLAFVGRMSPDKAPDAAIRIARAAGLPIRLAAKCRDVSERAYFDARVRPLLGPDVDWLGELSGPEARALMAGAAGLVFPIDWPEPFGMVMIEAMAGGTPVLARPCGAVPEVVEDGVTGFVRLHEDELAAAATRLHEIDRHACRAHVAERFSQVAMADAYERLLRTVVQRRGLRAG
jgi:glycosyltransferase involved in cell wall biosynthesis